MIRKISDLRRTADEVLIAEHDTHATHTSVGTGYYVEELERRSRDRAAVESQRLAEASHVLAARTYRLTIASTVLAVLAVAISVVALFAS